MSTPGMRAGHRWLNALLLRGARLTAESAQGGAITLRLTVPGVGERVGVGATFNYALADIRKAHSAGDEVAAASRSKSEQARAANEQ